MCCFGDLFIPGSGTSPEHYSWVATRTATLTAQISQSLLMVADSLSATSPVPSHSCLSTASSKSSPNYYAVFARPFQDLLVHPVPSSLPRATSLCSLYHAVQCPLAPWARPHPPHPTTSCSSSTSAVSTSVCTVTASEQNLPLGSRSLEQFLKEERQHCAITKGGVPRSALPVSQLTGMLLDPVDIDVVELDNTAAVTGGERELVQ